MGYSLADLRRIWFRASVGESVSDAEYRELEAAMEAGLTFNSIAEMADAVSMESFNELATEENRDWVYALTQRATTPAKHLIIGDSYVELGAFTEYIWKMGSYYNDFTPNSGTGAGVTWTNAANFFGTLTTTGALNSAGPQNYSIQITGVQTIGSFTFAGDSCEFYFDPAAGGTVDIAIDGGAPTSFVTSSTNGKTTITGLSRSVQHTCTITNTAGTSRFWGYYPGLANGTMQWYVIGHGGYDLQETMDCPQNLTFMSQVAPNRITLEFGINDYPDGSDDQLDLYFTRLETFVGQIRAILPLVSIDLWIPPYVATYSRWEEFSRRMRSKCRELGMSFYDSYATLGKVSGAEDVYNITVDDVHIGAPGTSMVALGFAEVTNPNPLSLDGGVATQAYVNKRRSGVMARASRFSIPSGYNRTTLAVTLNRLYYIPIHLTDPTSAYGVVCTGLQVESSAGGTAGSVVRLGLYATSASGTYPGAKLLESATIASTGTGALVFTPSPTNIHLVPGIYWLAVVAQVAAPTLRAHTLINQVASTAWIGSAQYNHYYEASVTGALPATAGTLVDGTATTPIIAFRG